MRNEIMILEQIVRRELEGRKVVLVMPVISQALSFEQSIRRLGVAGCLKVVAKASLTKKNLNKQADRDTTFGIGAKVLGANATESTLAFREALKEQNPALRQMIDEFDPDHTAIVLTPHTLVQGTYFYGRKVLNRTFKKWDRLEDKLISDRFFDRAQVTRARSGIYSTGRMNWERAFAKFNEGAGVVLIGHDGGDFVMGGKNMYFARNEKELARVKARMSDRYSRIKIMPYLRGTSFSSHALVVGRSVIVCPPFETLTLKREDELSFAWAGTSAVFAPRPADARAIKAMTHRVGQFLADQYGYRGGFCIDGILNANGIFLTEINMRFGASILRIGSSFKESPYLLWLLEYLVRAEKATGVSPRVLQQLFDHIFHSTRLCQFFVGIARRYQRRRRFGVIARHGKFSLSKAGKKAGKQCDVLISPAKGGSQVSFDFTVAKIDRGMLLGEHVEKIVQFLDERLELYFGRLWIA